MTKGIVWMVAARLMDRSIGIVSTLILARLLVPGDFGLVAMATAIGGLLDLLGAFSFDVALIQNAAAERRHYDTVWTINAVFQLVCAGALVALAGPAAAFYAEPRLAGVMYVLAVSYLLGAFGNVGVVAFRKELDFKKEFNFIFARRIVTFAATVTCAFMLRSYWALLIGITLGRMVGLIMSYTMNSYRPRFSLAAAGELFHFSKWMLINNGLAFVLRDGCTFVIGRVYGATSLGIYSVSYEISNLPSTELVAPINRVTLPGFAKIGDRAAIGVAYLRLLGIISLVILPVGLGIAAVAEPLVLTALGKNWVAAVALIAVLGINGAIAATQTNNTAVWLALGLPRRVTLLHGCTVLVLFPALYFFVKFYGVLGVGYAYILAQGVNVPLGMSMTKQLLGFSWAAVARVIWRPLVGSVAMYFLVANFDQRISEHMPLIRLLLDAAVGAGFYAAVVLTLWWISAKPAGAETYCLERAKVI
jgi:lipopolysaccharide exporter